MRLLTDEEIAERDAGFIYLDGNDVRRINELLYALADVGINVREFVDSLKEVDNER